MDIVNIPETENKYEDEWLLFEVVESDELDQPFKGILLMHSKDREDINRKLLEIKCKSSYVTFTGPPVPEGWAVVL